MSLRKPRYRRLMFAFLFSFALMCWVRTGLSADKGDKYVDEDILEKKQKHNIITNWKYSHKTSIKAVSVKDICGKRRYTCKPGSNGKVYTNLPFFSELF